MSLLRFYYDPFTEFDRLFDDTFISRFRPLSDTTAQATGPTSTWRNAFRPRLDLQENPDTNVVTARLELPGINPNDVQNDRLSVSGETTAAETLDEGNYVVRERTYGQFSRTLSLSPGTKPEDIKAKSVLMVTFPKASTEQLPKRITIT